MAAGSPRMIIVLMQCILIYSPNKKDIPVDMRDSLKLVTSFLVSPVTLVTTSMHTCLGAALTPQYGLTVAGYSLQPQIPTPDLVLHPSYQSYLHTRYQSSAILLLLCNISRGCSIEYLCSQSYLP